MSKHTDAVFQKCINPGCAAEFDRGQALFKCPECSERAGHRAAACERCRLVYSQHQKECPHCRSTSCTPVMTLEQATQARKDHEQYLKLEQEMVEGDGSQEEE